MALVQTDVGDLRVLQILADTWAAGIPLTFHLVQAPWTPGEGTVIGDLEECDFPGYTPLEAAGWTSPTLVSDKGMTAADPLIWTRTTTGAAQTIYGYWTEMDGFPGEVIWSELFDASVTLTNADESLVLYPQYTLTTE